MVGLVLALVLAICGGLALYGSSFAGGQVHDQLAAQKIAFPPQGDAALKALPAADAAAMSKYAGQPLTTGAQAKVYADNFIAVHLQGIGGGLTYSELSTQDIALSAQAKANPADKALAAKAAGVDAKVATVFKGTTLRSMLLSAYAFGTIATIASLAGIVLLIAAAVMLLLGVLGLVHGRKVSSSSEVFSKQPAHNLA
jgi:hypothetical protein